MRSPRHQLIEGSYQLAKIEWLLQKGFVFQGPFQAIGAETTHQ
jgi:hypothetical protein